MLQTMSREYGCSRTYRNNPVWGSDSSCLCKKNLPTFTHMCISIMNLINLNHIQGIILDSLLYQLEFKILSPWYSKVKLLFPDLVIRKGPIEGKLETVGAESPHVAGGDGIRMAHHWQKMGTPCEHTQNNEYSTIM